MSADVLGLEVRAGLPEALRVLVERYPREGWETHPHFTELTRFWLDRHLGFRRVQGLLLAGTEAFLDRGREPQAYARDLHRLASLLLNELHGHHHIEDAHYFPLLRPLDPRLARGFQLLDADHHALDAAMQGLAAATNAVLRAVGDGAAAAEPAGRLHGELARFGRLLDRHLCDEEEIVVPVILDNPGRAPG